MSEVWKAIPGYEGSYEVSDLGRVKSLARRVEVPTRWGNTTKRRLPERIMIPFRQHSGHLEITLQPPRQTFAVHRLVLEAFVGPCPEGLECCHGDGDPSNNRLENLRWDTRSANTLDAYRHGTRNGLEAAARMRAARLG